MSQLNDEILRATGGPTVNEGLALWFGKQKSEALNDAELRWLKGGDGAVGSTINDLWYTFLRAATLTGAINDMKLAYWKGALGPELVVNGDFSTDSVWTKGAGWTIAGGTAVGAAGSASALSQGPIALTPGNPYYVVFNIVTRTGGSVGPNVGTTLGTAQAAVGRHSEIILAGAGSLVAMDKDALFAGNVDSFSVRARLI